ncbi:unnamed protein product [Diabrotica balteata]|uniref:SID1 transmembrane family member 1-like n=1 Tax=Diabrotica balteata TaxID=107213 RepID=A0A9N9X8G3_DIABA|nr:unnamed protein product [Diabrotica balteata]
MKSLQWILLAICFGSINCSTNTLAIEQQVLTNGNAITKQLNENKQIILLYRNFKSMNPYRIITSSSNAKKEFPVLIVAEQRTQVTAWSIPMLIESAKPGEEYSYNMSSKTLCHDYMNIITLSPGVLLRPLYFQQNFIVALSTASPTNINVTVELQEEKIFYLKQDTNYNISVGPSEPRYAYFRFEKDTADTVVIEVDSEDELCLTISVQDSKCPVFDNNKDVKYEGIHQTINTKGAITLMKHSYKDGFFLVFVSKPDTYECSQESSVLPRLTRTVSIEQMVRTHVNFVIRNSITANDYTVAVGATFLILVGTGVLVTVAALIFHRYGTIARNKYEDVIVTDYFEALSEEQISSLLKSLNLTVSEFSRHPKRIKKRSYNYLYHTLSIAIFYSIPVVQLVFTYQRIVNRTGDEDMCYYNFLCAHPAFRFSDFNHIFSNIGYVIFGIIFICVVADRHRIIKMRKEKGIPVHYGIFHAMGVALIIEGLLSACYHICPSQSNYQFDTSFMYIMAVLCMVKLYQNRHPDINATAYTTFTVLGCAIFMAMIGILNGNLAIWIIFVVCYTLLCLFLSLKIYFLNYVVDGLNQFRNSITKKGFTQHALKPIRKARFIILLIANIANYSMLIVGLLLYSDNVTDFGTFLLALLMGNSVIHCVFYTCMKLISKEKICYEAILYGVLAIVCWGSSSVFFLDAATLWTVTPAESRQWNQECIALKFFDKHDIWHLLSAPALYFTFMYLMCLDDDILDVEQRDLHVF